MRVRAPETLATAGCPALPEGSPRTREFGPSAILALQRTAGNAVVTAMLQRQPRQPPPRDPSRLLTPRAAAAAVTAMTVRYDENSIRFLKRLVGRPVDGTFTEADAETIAVAQKGAGQTATGQADEAFLDLVFPLIPAEERFRSQAIHLVIDHAGIDVSGAFSIHWDPSETGAGVVTASRGGVNSIRLGSGAFANYRTMVTTIRAQLATASPTAAGTPVAGTTLADPNLHAVLIATNQSRLPQVRSIRTIQSSVGAPVTGRWDLDTVRHIAAKQQASGAAAPGGLLEEATIEALGRDLLAAQQFDAVLYLILDYYRFDTSHALDVRYEPVQALSPRGTPPLAETKFTGLGLASPVVVYPAGVAQPWPGLVHTLAHELGHTEQMVNGVASEDVREFLSEGIEIVSHGMPEEGIETPADIDGMLANSRQPASLAFVDDVLTMLRRWDAMQTAEKRTHLARFREIRTHILQRIDARASADQKTALAPLITRLNAADAVGRP
jgi:hypothetical protein